MKQSFVSPLFWEVFSLGKEFLDNSSFSTLKMLFHYLFASIISDEKSVNMFIFAPLYIT